jgi:hypothetical protein
VVIALAIRLSSSSVSIRSEFQIIDRSVTFTIGQLAPDLAHPLAAGFERFLGAEHGGVFLHGALHLLAQLGRRRRTRSVAQPSKRVMIFSNEASLTAGIADSRSITSPARIAAARPNTTRSISELEPRRLAPCTEAQPASPTAIRPGDPVRILLVGLSTSPQ